VPLRLALPILAVCVAFAAAGCGSSSKSSAPTTAPAPTTTAPAPAPATTAAAPPSALQAEATSKAAGDIPDNQVFLTYRNAAAGYSMKYPEGWAQQGGGKTVTIRDKNNIVRVVVQRDAMPTMAALNDAVPTGAQVRAGPARLRIGTAKAFKETYTTQSAPNPVTGKRVTLTVDRYYIPGKGRFAIVDLGTPVGVDNVDAYRMMVESFRWL
jgi:hypothetical protein